MFCFGHNHDGNTYRLSTMVNVVMSQYSFINIHNVKQEEFVESVLDSEKSKLRLPGIENLWKLMQ